MNTVEQNTQKRKIFISYRRADNPGFVRRIRDWFANKYERENVFMDFDSIGSFADFAETIRETVPKCDVVIAIIGPQWLSLLKEKLLNYEDDYVRLELELALEAKKLIAPICIMDASLPKAEELPPPLRPILQFNAARLNDDQGYYDDIARVMQGVEAQLARHTEQNQIEAAKKHIDGSIDMFLRAFNAEAWAEADEWLNHILTFEEIPLTFELEELIRAVATGLQEQQQRKDEHERAARAYRPIQLMANQERPNRDMIWRALQRLWQIYPDYDPDNLGRQYRQPLPVSFPLRFIHPPLGTWLEEENGWQSIDWGKQQLNVLFALYDAEETAQQLPLSLDLMNGHIVMFGALGTGKTTFLRTFLLSLVTQYAPDQVQIYIVDFGGFLSFAKDFPHVGAYIRGDETERLERLATLLETVIDERQINFGNVHQDNVQAFNANLSSSEAQVPHIVVLVDDFGELSKYEELTTQLASVIRNGRAYGVHFVVTSAEVYLRRVSTLFSQRLTLQQNANGDYREIIGVAVEDILYAGRGYFNLAKHPLLFQVAMPIILGADEKQAGESVASQLSSLARAMRSEWTGALPPSLSVLPMMLPLADLHVDDIPDPTTYVPIGLKDIDLTPMLIECGGAAPHILIVGDALSGRTTTLRTIILMLMKHNPPEHVRLLLVDPLGKLWDYGKEGQFAQLPHIAGMYTDNLSTLQADVTDALKMHTSAENNPHVYIVFDNFELVQDSREHRFSLDEFAVFVRHFDRQNLHLIAAQGGTMYSNKLLARIQSARRVIALDQSGVERAGQRFPSKYRNWLLPKGRAFVYVDNALSVVQLAAPVQLVESYLEQIHAQWVTATSVPARAEVRPPFKSLAEATAALTASNEDLRQKYQVLVRGAWVGRQATFFYELMDSELLPTLERIVWRQTRLQELNELLNQMEKDQD